MTKDKKLILELSKALAALLDNITVKIALRDGLPLYLAAGHARTVLDKMER